MPLAINWAIHPMVKCSRKKMKDLKKSSGRKMIKSNMPKIL